MIYDYFKDFLLSLFGNDGVAIYETYINDISFILTMLFVVMVAVVPLIICINIGSNLFIMFRNRAETRGSKKRKWNIIQFNCE